MRVGKIVVMQVKFGHSQRKVAQPDLLGIQRIEAEREHHRTGDLFRMALLQLQKTKSLQRPRLVRVERERALKGVFGIIDPALNRQYEAADIVCASIVGLERQ